MQAQQTIMINAPIEIVWSILTDIEQWPGWQTAVSVTSLQGELEQSTEFLWKSGSMKIRSKIQDINAPFNIRWSGRALGVFADHSWSLTSIGSDTQVTTSEHMSGWLVASISLFKKNFLENALKEFLFELKLASEGRHQTASGVA